MKEVEGRSVGLVRPEPIRFMLISGQKLINERIREMLQRAKNEVLWIAPKAEIKRGVNRNLIGIDCFRTAPKEM